MDLIMRNYRIILITVVYILFLSISVNCKSKTEQDFIGNANVSGINTEITANGIRLSERKHSNLQILFDGKNTLSLAIDPTLDGKTLLLDFIRPVYIREVIITIDLSQDNQNSYSNEVLFDIYADTDGLPCDGFNYIISGKEESHRILFKSAEFATILKFKMLGINFRRTIYIKELKIVYSNIPLFIPTMDVEDMQKRYIKSKGNEDKEWEFSFGDLRDGEVEKLELKILQNLVHKALLGDKNAENLFLNFSPTSADKGEYISCIHDWYLSCKNNNTNH